MIKPTVTAKRLAKSIRDGYPVIVEEGGTSSGKTFGTVFILILLCYDQEYRHQILGKNWPDLADKPLRVSIVSDSLPNIKKGVYRDFMINMNLLNCWDNNRWRATDFVYHFPDGSYIELFGLEDEGKARGPRRDILYMNEANNNRLDVYYQLAMRTTGPKILDLNPADFNCWVYDLADKPENKRLHSTYLDNIQNLTQEQIRFIESYKALPDPYMWTVYGLGLRGASEEIIYRGWQLVDRLPGKGEVVYGLDFGFNHPNAFVKVEIYEGAIYAQEIIYTSGQTKPELNAVIRENVGDSAYIYADAAEPDSIEELYRMGLNIHPANKDVWNGIITVKSHPLFITRDSKNLIREMQGYKWKKDKNDLILEEPVKQDDDACDALRYAVHTYFSKPKITWLTL